MRVHVEAMEYSELWRLVCLGLNDCILSFYFAFLIPLPQVPSDKEHDQSPQKEQEENPNVEREPMAPECMR